MSTPPENVSGPSPRENYGPLSDQGSDFNDTLDGAEPDVRASDAVLGRAAADLLRRGGNPAEIL